MLLRNGLFFADGHFWENLCVRLENGRVTAMGEGLAPLDGEAVIDLQGDFVLPGFVDAHIHAFRGHDTMQGEDAIRQMARELYQEGVAAFLPTTMSASVEDTRRVIAAVRRVMDAPAPRGCWGRTWKRRSYRRRRQGRSGRSFFCIRAGRHSLT